MSLTLHHRRHKIILPGTNTLAYFSVASVTKEKKGFSIGAELSGAVLSVLTVEQILEQNNTVRMVEHKSAVVIGQQK